MTLQEIPLEKRTYRNTIGLFTTGVAVLAVEVETTVHTITVNTLTSVSLEPLLMLVCLHKESQIVDHITQSGYFSINILHETQADLSQYFAAMWSENEPPPYQWHAWLPHAPYLADTLGALACKPYNIVDGGDHWVIIGEVVGLQQADTPGQPLLYYQGQYQQLAKAT